ncbi:Efflux pump radE [Fulvia fulva]|nr:Efflux pump radE [Fulvia fulva]KAK4620947.1 Efflux pump radE [Fulvia fulva]WPV17439.1 Efflux pump radE [Fulvia fulva]WPV31991.1 Efflux pump radE [Fulvia fulva]
MQADEQEKTSQWAEHEETTYARATQHTSTATATIPPASESTADKVQDDAASIHGEFDVYWENETDPENPLNWPQWRKVSNIAMTSFVTFLTPLASSMFAPGVPETFKTDSNTAATFVVSIFVLGFAFGPIVVAPASKLYGRLPVYHICNILFTIFTICNAVSTNMAMLMAFHFLAGFAGVGAVTIGSGSVADMMPPEQRGISLALWSLGFLFGPIVGPIAGGFPVAAMGWRWVFWIIAILSGATTLICFLVLKETLATIILEKKALRLRKSTENLDHRSRVASPLAPKTLMAETCVRPLKILLFTPVASWMCMYIALLYGLLYILFTTFTFVFTETYKLSTTAAGLSYLGCGVGTLIGLAFAARLSDRIVRRKVAAGITPLPEDRLPLYMALPGSLAIPIGFLIYGWGAHFRVHWIVPQIGTAVMSFGTIVILMYVQTYLTDVYTVHAAIAIAANAVLRSLLGALLPLLNIMTKRKRDSVAPDASSKRTMATRAMTRAAAVDAVFMTTELLEGILQHLPMKDLLLSQRVCHKWKSVIEQSQCLQQALFFLPREPDFAWLYPRSKRTEHIITRVSTGHMMEGKHDIVVYPSGEMNPMFFVQGSNIIKTNKAFPGSDNGYEMFRYHCQPPWLDCPEGSWRKMLSSQPPVKAIDYHWVCAGHLQNGLVNQTEPITLADMGKLFINPGKLDDATFYGHGQSNHLATEGILYPKTSEKDVYRIMGRNGKRYVQGSANCITVEIEGPQFV